MAPHRFHIDHPVATGPLSITGDEAHHAARVKRVAIGETVEVLDGRGGIGRGAISGVHKNRTGWSVEVQIEATTAVPRPATILEVCTAIPKGSKLSDLIDGLAQVGAAAWRPLETERSIREHWRPDKLERVAAEAGKQCGRAWRLEIGGSLDLSSAVRGGNIIIADASGERFDQTAGSLRLLVGPEGGWSNQELAAARAAGARVCRFGIHTMRIETAAMVAAGIIMQS